uniref:Inositol-tetrakisphosphate 1-kinase n=1 Tax=Callithrix jacchus TaxID=9483 RepID=A0A8I3X3D3_CALJA
GPGALAVGCLGGAEPCWGYRDASETQQLGRPQRPDETCPHRASLPSPFPEVRLPGHGRPQAAPRPSAADTNRLPAAPRAGTAPLRGGGRRCPLAATPPLPCCRGLQRGGRASAGRRRAAAGSARALAAALLGGQRAGTRSRRKCRWRRRDCAPQHRARFRVPAAGRRCPLARGARRPPDSACGRFPPDPGSPPEEEDADLSEREESWLLAERKENQEAQFPGLRRAVQLNLNRPIEEQGPLDVIIHKLTDVILEADQNDSQSLELVHRFQEYIDAHPETIILDPLPAIRTLLDRSKSYELIRKIEAYMEDDRICSPPFMELTSLCGDDTMRLLEKNGLAFPFICKTRVAHGTNSHEMAIVFNQEGLNAIQPPCVVQNFINHNAVLYKVFVVGESYTVVQRPSLKNFSAGTSDRESIFFNSHNVSKPESSSVLTELDKIEGVFERPSDEVIRELSRALRQALGVSLFGIDIIINNQTGQHAVIDINAFPGPFWEELSPVGRRWRTEPAVEGASSVRQRHWSRESVPEEALRSPVATAGAAVGQEGWRTVRGGTCGELRTLELTLGVGKQPP